MIEFIKNKIINYNTRKKIENWYLSHTRRDQIIIQTIAVLILLVLFWGIIFQPLLKWHNEQKESERISFSLLTTIKSNDSELEKTKANEAGLRSDPCCRLHTDFIA